MASHEKNGQLRAPSTPADGMGHPLGEKCHLLLINLKKIKSSINIHSLNDFLQAVQRALHSIMVPLLQVLHAVMVGLLGGASVNKHSNHFSCVFLVKSEFKSHFKQFKMRL